MAKTIDMTNPAAVQGTFIAAGSNDYDPKLLTASIRQIASNGKKADARIHATAHALLSRSADHKDCSLVPSLIDAMPKSSRRKALIAWFHAFSNVTILVNKETGKVTARMTGPDAKAFKSNMDELRLQAFDKPFWSVEEKDTNPADFDSETFAKAVAALIKRAEADNAKLDIAGKDALADLKVLRTKLPELA